MKIQSHFQIPPSTFSVLNWEQLQRSIEEFETRTVRAVTRRYRLSPLVFGKPLETVVFLAIAFAIFCAAPAHAVPAVAPTITPDAIVVASGSVTVTITSPSTASGAVIYYTLNGTVPSILSPVYSAALQIDGTTTVKAIAAGGGLDPSSVSTGFIQLDPLTQHVPRSGLLAWMKPDNGVVLGTGTAVSRWLDSSGNGKTALAGTAAPDLILGDRFPFIRFDGASQFFTWNSLDPNLASGTTIFVVANPASISQGKRFVHFGKPGTVDDSIHLSEESSSTANMTVYQGSTSESMIPASSLSSNTWQVLEAIQHGNNTGSFWTSASQEADAVVLQNIPNVSRTSNGIGATGAGSNFFNGDISEVLAYDRPVTSSERLALENYFALKYGTADGVAEVARIVSNAFVQSNVVRKGPVEVKIDFESGAEVRFTTDGTNPIATSSLYTSPLSLNFPTGEDTIIVKAVAVHSFGLSPRVHTAYFHRDPWAYFSLNIPSNNVNYHLWLKPEVGLETSNGSVVVWHDLSRNRADAVQPLIHQRPILGTHPVTGGNTVVFDGLTQYLRVLPFDAGTSISIFAVVRPNQPSADHIVHFGARQNYKDLILERLSGGTGISFFGGWGSISATNAIANGQYQVIEANLPPPGGTSTISVNGTVVASGGLGSGYGGMHGLNSIATIAGADASFMKGELAELIVSTALADGDRRLISAYLINKYQTKHVVPSAPIFSVAGGTLTAVTQLALSSQAGDSIFFTTNNSIPTTGSTLYTAPIDIRYSQTVKAIAVRNGIASSVQSQTYTLNSSTFPAPDAGDTTPLDIRMQLPTTSIPQ